MTAFESLIRLIETEPSECRTFGFSGVEVYRLPSLQAYLKIGETDKISDLGRERNVLDWLNGRFPVPKVLDYGANEEKEALLLTEIEGNSLSDLIADQSATEEIVLSLIQKGTRVLRALHDMNYDNCPFDMNLSRRFDRCFRSIQLGTLSESDEEFAAEHEGRLPIDVYNDLRNDAPPDEDIVFTHGDPCLPNLLFKDGEFAGLIDLDGGGLADRYVDISIFVRSAACNSHIQLDFAGIFAESYGLENLDMRKLDFYTVIDDLF